MRAASLSRASPAPSCWTSASIRLAAFFASTESAASSPASACHNKTLLRQALRFVGSHISTLLHQLQPRQRQLLSLGRGRAQPVVLFLAGPPGLGKTTLANVIANVIATATAVQSSVALPRPGPRP